MIPKKWNLALTLAAVLAGSGNAQQTGKFWADYGGGPDNSHFQSGNQITKANVGQLKLAWTYPTGDNAGYLFNPIVANNVAYVMARNGSLVAIDALKGTEIWVHEGLQ